MTRYWRRLSTQILVTQLVVLLLCGAMGFVLTAYFVRHRLDHEFEQRALAVATSMAALPSVRDQVETGDPDHQLQQVAEAVRQRSKVAYVVIADRQGIRFSHPNPSLIGKHVSTPFAEVLGGKDWVGVQTGTLGRSARGKAPILDQDHHVIGVVSVGILESRVTQTLWHVLATIALCTGVAIAVGVAASLLLSRRIKGRTFGLELDEIADLLQEREAMLHGVREGVVAMDVENRVRLVNDEARRLLGIHDDAVSRPLTDLVPQGYLRDVLNGDVAGEDAMVITEDRVLMVNRVAVGVSDRDLGAVVTMRDRTETEDLVRQVDAATALTSTLRAQTHEFSNRLHTLLGLLELERYADAIDFIAAVAGEQARMTDMVTDRIRDPTVAALLIAKVSVAGEKGIDLRLAPDSLISGRCGAPVDVVTVVGNLIDNAVEAAAAADPPGDEPRWVEVDLRQRGTTLGVTVYDSGPGVPAQLRDSIFVDGFSTKPSGAKRRRGVGLALVSQAVRRRGGIVQVLDGDHGGFHASLPNVLTPAPQRMGGGEEG